MKIKVSNPSLDGEERSYLTADYSSGTTLTVRNSDNFTTNWYVVVGEPGQEQTELRRVTATPTDTTITIDSALRFSHPKSTTIYRSQWSQITFQRKIAGGSFAEESDSPFDIQWDNEDKKTLIVVASGATTDTYRWRFYNSTTVISSDWSDELVGTGLTRYKVGHLIQQIKKNPTAQTIDDQLIIDYFNDYQADIVYPEIPKAWWFSKEGTQVSTVASTYTYSVSDNWSDFRAMRFLLYRYISGDTDIKYPLTYSPPQEFYNLKSDANQEDDDNVKYWTLLPPDSSSAKGYIAMHPTPETADCYIQPVHYFELTDLDSFGDTIVVPHPKGYLDYAWHRIFADIKQDNSNAEKYDRKVGRSITYLKRLNRRQLGQPELFRFRGTRAHSRMFGEGGRLDSQTAKELYW